MEIKRDAYLQQLIERKDNGMIKVITGFVDAENHFYCLPYLRDTYWKMVLIQITLLKLHWTVSK